jgi:AraC-like DNA-binding protein
MRDSIQSMRCRDLEKLLAQFPAKPGFDEEVSARTLAFQALRNGDANWRGTFKAYASVLFARNYTTINNLRRKIVEFITLILREIDSRNPINYPFRRVMEELYRTFVMSSLLRLFTEAVEEFAPLIKPERENALRSAEKSPHPLVIQALAFMKPRFQKPIGLSDVAEAVHASPAYLSRQFRKQTGHTLTDALQYLRIQHARELLANSNEGTLQIALACGFNTPEHFFRTFRKLTGQSPRAFRRTQSV